DTVRSHTIIGVIAAIARSLAPPVQAPASAARLPASSSACVSREIANASHPAAACSIGAVPAPAINREVFTSGGIACQNIDGAPGTSWAVLYRAGQARVPAFAASTAS